MSEITLLSFTLVGSGALIRLIDAREYWMGKMDTLDTLFRASHVEMGLTPLAAIERVLNDDPTLLEYAQEQC